MRKLLFATALTILAASSASAKPYEVDYAKSSIEFKGSHAGKEFTGKFNEWTAQIDFDADKLDTSSIKASFTTSSAVTGDKMYDGTLPNEDWFNVEKFPKAEFVSTSIKSEGKGNYIAEGNLTIRNITKPARIVFAITDLSGDPVTVAAGLVLNRLDYDIGKKSDPNADWVSQEIGIKINLLATPK